jgi:DNA repair exonuclease SbcCD ATPase subunit
MKIIFERVRIKNFLSFGNNETIFDYQKGINVVTGIIEGSTKRNGVGKSTLLVDSLSFALYGRPLRGDAHINKENLINDVNGRECSVSVDFRIDKDEYTVTRTIKPNGLTIKHNGQDVKFDSMKNTQEWLINKIGISHTCFSNILVLNVNSSQPFLAMDAALKREVIEDVLSLNIYGRMAESAKNIHLASKGDKSIVETELKSYLKQLQVADESLKSLKEKQDKFDEEKRNHCEDIENDIKTLQTKFDSIVIDETDYASQLQAAKTSLTNIDSKILLLVKKEAEYKKDMKNASDMLKNLEHETSCPTCRTVLADSPLAQKFMQECRDTVETCRNNLNDIASKKEAGQKARQAKTDDISSLEEKIKSITSLKNRRDIIQSQIDSKKMELSKEQSRTLDLGSVISEDKYQEYKNAVKKAETKMTDSINTFEYSKLIRNMLGEDGVRKFVLSKIMPFFNTKINHYLKIMGSDYSLVFDNNLVEKVITRTREVRDYNNFSSGEKKRIDLSILLALMDIAKVQNSVDTNILVLDEVLDTSMDNEGVESFLFFLKNGFKQLYGDKCIYIITHRSDISADNFDRIVALKKTKNFTIIDKIVEMQP